MGALDGDISMGDGLAECIVVVGPLGDIRSAGGRTADVLGVAARQLAGTHLKQLLSRPDRGRLFDMMREALAGSSRQSIVDQLAAAGDFGALVSVVPMEADGAGQVHSWVLRFARRQPPETTDQHREPSIRTVRRGDLSPAAIERALHDEEFSLDLQPIIDLDTGMSVECEALVRWETPDGERLAAGAFIDDVERAGLMSRLTTYVLERSLDQLADWSGPQSGQRMTVNVTAADLVRPGFARLVGRLVANAGVDPSRLVLEFGGDLLRVDIDSVERAFDGLRRYAGVRLAIDQRTVLRSPVTAFGLQVDAVKLEPASSLKAVGSSLDASILAMFTDVCLTSGISVIGTGIEEQQQVEALQRAGCSLGQGYLLGRPSPSTVGPPISTDRAVRLAIRPDATIAWPALQRALEHWRANGENGANGATPPTEARLEA